MAFWEKKKTKRKRKGKKSKQKERLFCNYAEKAKNPNKKKERLFRNYTEKPTSATMWKSQQTGKNLKTLLIFNLYHECFQTSSLNYMWDVHCNLLWKLRNYKNGSNLCCQLWIMYLWIRNFCMNELNSSVCFDDNARVQHCWIQKTCKFNRFKTTGKKMGQMILHNRVSK